MRLFKRQVEELYSYDTSGEPLFDRDDLGGEKYRVDEKGCQMYPKRGRLFARDPSGVPYYAVDAQCSEYYPIRNKKSAMIRDGDGCFRVARHSSDKERYPVDSHGREFYLLDSSKRPRVLKDENGREYFARDGDIIIPWNYMGRYREDLHRYDIMLDAGRNIVFTKKRLSCTLIACLGFRVTKCCIVPMTTLSSLLGVLLSNYDGGQI